MASSRSKAAEEGYWTREHALVMVLVVVTAVSLGLCIWLLRPFSNILAWAIALAVVAHPLHAWTMRVIKNSNGSAAAATVIVAALIIAPAVFVLQQLASEVGRIAQVVQSGELTAQFTTFLQRYPQLAAVQQWIEPQLGGGSQKLFEKASTFVVASLAVIVQLLLTCFFLFFLFRDRHQALRGVRSLVPLAEKEVDEVFNRVSDTIHATIYGTLAVAGVQGALGGLMFAALGLPAPLLWAVVMAFLALVPVLGTFVVWVPAAIYLCLSGEWIRGIILVVWGAGVIATIDNFLYPFLVGKRLRMHTAVVFIAILGGLSAFGAAGIILGPVILAITQALIDVWRRRTRHGTAEEAVTPAK